MYRVGMITDSFEMPEMRHRSLFKTASGKRMEREIEKALRHITA
jgi:hypothetical protein